MLHLHLAQHHQVTDEDFPTTCCHLELVATEGLPAPAGQQLLRPPSAISVPRSEARDHADPPAEKRRWSLVDLRERCQLNYVAELWGEPKP